MFPYSSNPYPSFLPSSSSSLFPFPFLNPENASPNNNNNTLFHDPFSIPYIPTHHHHSHPPHHLHNISNIPETLTNLAVSQENHHINSHNNNNNIAVSMPKQDPLTLGGGSHYGISCFLTKKPPKKDRHSKIYTSQGLRDRRVRLSIEIARKFFDLQEMLGFDKASNTLDWLFTKSKRAIKDLTKSKQRNNNSEVGDDAKSFTSSSDCEDSEVATNDSSNLQKEGAGSKIEEKKLKRVQIKEPACVRASKMKESREKARARARERTSNKISTRGVQEVELKKKYENNSNNNLQAFHQSRSSSQDHQLVSSNEAQRDNFNVIEESIVIKRKLKPSLMLHHHHHHQHQNHVIPKEATSFSNNGGDYHFLPNSSPNWDANNGTSSTNRSSFCAIASMNLSTGLQIFGKSWEECTNPRLH